MKVGDKINTPRFKNAPISHIFHDRYEAYVNGFNEPTGYSDAYGNEVWGRSKSMYKMEFAAVLRKEVV